MSNAFNNISDEDIQLLGENVIEIAFEIFEACGCPEDFCVQSASGALFGGTNRIQLTKFGWRASSHHCTQRFLRVFANTYGEVR